MLLAASVHTLAPPTRPWKLWDLVRRVCPRSGQAEVVALHRGDHPSSNEFMKELHVSPPGFLISWMVGEGEVERVHVQLESKIIGVLFYIYCICLLHTHMHAHTSNPKGE